MKKLILILMSIAIVSYANEPQLSPTVDPYILAEEKPSIIVNSAIDYENDLEDPFEEVLMYGSFFDVPKVIKVVEGESNDQLLSLIIGERKFCYQGQGNEFVYKGELVYLSDDCEDGNLEPFTDDQVYSEYGDLIVARIHNISCDESCGYSEVEFAINPSPEEE
jgi:hypothetical protein